MPVPTMPDQTMPMHRRLRHGIVTLPLVGLVGAVLVGAAVPAAGTVAAQDDPAPSTTFDRPTIDSDRVVLRWLDKSTARVDQIAVPVGERVTLEGVEVLVRACRRTAPDQAPEDAAFLEISENRPGEAPRKIFQGWMFASSPSLSALEHPVYDVWVLECADASGGGADSAASADETASGSQ